MSPIKISYHLPSMMPGALLFFPFLRLFAVMVAVGLSACLLLCIGMAIGILLPPRMRNARAILFLRRLSPADLDLPYRDLNFTVRDHRTVRPLRISGWWIDAPAPSDRTVILIHGYSDGKIGALAWAPLFRSLGFNILAVDQRAHGDSQGLFITAGFHERHDFSQVIDQLKSDHHDQTRKLVLFGVSLGAAAAAATAALRSDVSAVILDCPFKDFPSAVLSHAESLPVPGRLFQSMAVRIAELIARADFSQVRPVDFIANLACPIWIIQSTLDPFVPPEDQDAIAYAIASRPNNLPPAHFWRAEGSFHVLALADHPAEYTRRLTDFLEEALAEKIPPASMPLSQREAIHP